MGFVALVVSGVFTKICETNPLPLLSFPRKRRAVRGTHLTDSKDSLSQSRVETAKNPRLSLARRPLRGFANFSPDSHARKRETSSTVCAESSALWVPACAGMTNYFGRRQTW